MQGPGVHRHVLILSRRHPSLSFAYVTHFIFSARPGKTQPACNGLCYDTHVKCSLLYQTHYMLNAVRHAVFLDPLFRHNAIILHKWWGFDSGQKHRRAPALGASIHQVQKLCIECVLVYDIIQPDEIEAEIGCSDYRKLPVFSLQTADDF